MDDFVYVFVGHIHRFVFRVIVTQLQCVTIFKQEFIRCVACQIFQQEKTDHQQSTLFAFIGF